MLRYVPFFFFFLEKFYCYPFRPGYFIYLQMAAGGVKIIKPGGEKLDKFEESVSQVSALSKLVIGL